MSEMTRKASPRRAENSKKPQLKTRKPTGQVTYPLILVEGDEKSGKSYACAVFSASNKVGQTYWLDLGEGAADEYGAVSGARYLVVEHDGTWQSIFESVQAVRSEASRAAAAGEPPVVLVIDSMTAEWRMLSMWASGRAKNSYSNRKKIEEDPDVKIDVSSNYWNDANTRHAELMMLLTTFPGIVVLTARGKEVAVMDDNGNPVRGKKDYKVEGHKSLAYDVTAWVRLSRNTKPAVVAVRSVHTSKSETNRPKEEENFTLEWLVFDLLKFRADQAHVRDLVELKPDEKHNQAVKIRDAALETDVSLAQIKDMYSAAAGLGVADVVVTNENGDDEKLLALIVRIGTEMKKASPSSEKPEQLVS